MSNMLTRPVANSFACLFIFLVPAGMLFVQFENARAKSQQTACSQNLKQLTLAINQYEQDRGSFPQGLQFFGKPQLVGEVLKWTNLIAPYLKADEKAMSASGKEVIQDPGIFASQPPGDKDELYPECYRCPTARDWDKVGFNMSYGYNYHYLGDARPAAVLLSDKSVTGFVHYPISKSKIARPDRTICFADSAGTGIDDYVSAKANPSGPQNRNAGAFAFLLDPTFLPVFHSSQGDTVSAAAGGLVVTQKAAITLALGDPTHQSYRSIVSNRHRGKANVAFLDGHVESMVREMCYFRKATTSSEGHFYPSNELWNGFGVDNDMNGDGIIDAKIGEKLIDPNEAFQSGNEGKLSERVKKNYSPGVATSGYGKLSQLTGDYGLWGPGFDSSLFFKSPTSEHFGPTLPHRAPFDLFVTEK